MYKKITHNIVEEHFAHPQLARAASMQLSTKPRYNPANPLPQNRIFFRSLLWPWLWGLQEFTDRVALKDSSLSIISSETELVSAAGEISNIFRTQVGNSISTVLGNKFMFFTQDIVSLIRAKVAQQPTDELTSQLQKSQADIASYLFALNPYWTPESVTIKLDAISSNQLARVDNILAGNWIAASANAALTKNALYDLIETLIVGAAEIK